MTRKTALALLCLALPLLVLGSWIGSLSYDRATAKSYHVIVEGYDPRDLLHGRYLNLRYVWDDARSEKPDLPVKDLPESAQYYVPEWDARDLETMLLDRKNTFSARVSISATRVQIKDLLIDDRAWEESLAAWRENRDNQAYE